MEKARSNLRRATAKPTFHDLYGALLLYKLTKNHRDLVNLVYVSQGKSRPLTFDEAAESIRSMAVASKASAETRDSESKSLINRTKSGRIKKGKKKGDKVKCSHCKKPGHQEEKCWNKHPELAPDFIKKEKSTESTEKDKKQNPIRASVCRTARASKATESNENWYLDSEATDYMTNDKRTLRNFKPFTFPKSIELGDNSIIKAYGHGTVDVGKFTLREVLYAPKLGLNLISINKVTREFGEVSFGISHATI